MGVHTAAKQVQIMGEVEGMPKVCFFHTAEKQVQVIGKVQMLGSGAG